MLRDLRFPILLLALLAMGFPALAQERIDISKVGQKIEIKPGQQLLVQFDREGNTLKNARIVQTKDYNEGVSLEFKTDQVEVDGKTVPLLILLLESRLNKTLLCRCAIRLKGRKDFFETSILPLPATFTNSESWSDPIEDMVLFDFSLSDEDPSK